jgi:hypothetical protein
LKECGCSDRPKARSITCRVTDMLVRGCIATNATASTVRRMISSYSASRGPGPRRQDGGRISVWGVYVADGVQAGTRVVGAHTASAPHLGSHIVAGISPQPRPFRRLPCERLPAAVRIQLLARCCCLASISHCRRLCSGPTVDTAAAYAISIVMFASLGL